MIKEEKKETKIPEVPGWILAVGSVLIIAGALAGFYVGREVLQIYLDFRNNPFIGGLKDRFKDTDLFSFGDTPLVVTEQGATIIAFALFILLAFLAVNIAIAFIRAGAHIMSPAFPYQLTRLKLRIDNLRKHIGVGRITPK